MQDFVADRLLRLPLVPQLEPQRVATFLRRASPYKVVVLVFGRGGGSGSLPLRSLAARQKNMLTIARGQVQVRQQSRHATAAESVSCVVRCVGLRLQCVRFFLGLIP